MPNGTQSKLQVAGLAIDHFPLSYLPPNEELICPEPSTSFIQSVQAYGVLQPILLLGWETTGGEAFDKRPMSLCDGRNRIRVSRMLGHTHIPARVLTTSVSDSKERERLAALIALIANEQRRDNPISDLRAINCLGGEAERDTIRLLTHIAPNRLRRKIRMGELDPQFHKAVTEGKLSIPLAERICRLAPAQQEHLMGLLNNGQRITHEIITKLCQANMQNALNVMPGELFQQLDILDLVGFQEKSSAQIADDFSSEIYDDKQVKNYEPFTHWEDSARDKMKDLLGIVPEDHPMFSLLQKSAQMLGLSE